jgi:hypothetical protein
MLDDCTESLDTQKVYTLLGIFNNENEFTQMNRKVIRCMAYRHLRLEIIGQLSVVNIKYMSGFVNAWVIFQTFLLPANVIMD